MNPLAASCALSLGLDKLIIRDDALEDGIRCVAVE
jgi:hypothetical protein